MEMRSLPPLVVRHLTACLAMSMAVPSMAVPSMAVLAMTAPAAGQASAKAPVDRTVCGVVWGPSLEPVANAAVTLRGADWGVLKKGKTDSAGRFSISGLASRPAYCCATAPGLHSGCELTPASQPGSPAYVDIKLFAAALIRGVVKDDAGNPVKDARVIAAFDHAGTLFDIGSIEEATTTEKGYFVLPKVPLGDIVVRASADGFVLGQSEVLLRGDREVDVVMQRGKGRTLSVIVKGVPKDRLAEVRCSLSVRGPYPQPTMLLPRRLLEGSLDENGEWLVTGLPRDVALSMIRVSAPGMRFDKQSQSVPAGENGKLTFELKSVTAPKAAPRLAGEVEDPTLHGVLLDEKKRALRGVQVTLSSTSTGVRYAVTDERGRFACNASYKPGESVSFSVRDPDWVLSDDDDSMYWVSQAVRREYVTDMLATLTATAATKFSGKVRAARGVDVTGLRVAVETVMRGSGSSGERMFLGETTTDADGEFLVEGLPPLKEPAWLVIGGMRGVAAAGPYKVKSKRFVKNVRLKLRKPVMVTGTAVDKKGKPIAGARIRLVESGGDATRSLYGGLHTLTDGEGRFAFRGMKPGEYLLQVRIRGAKVVASSKSFKVGLRRSLEKTVKVTGR